jgi:hypothetical protein
MTKTRHVVLVQLQAVGIVCGQQDLEELPGLGGLGEETAAAASTSGRWRGRPTHDGARDVQLAPLPRRCRHGTGDEGKRRQEDGKKQSQSEGEEAEGGTRGGKGVAAKRPSNGVENVLGVGS